MAKNFPMTTLLKSTVFCLLALMVIAMSTAKADQTDTRLPALFEELKKADDKTTAESTARQIWKIWSQYPQSPAIEKQLAAATLLMNAGKFAKAEQILTTIISEHPDFAEAWNRRATLYFLQGQFEASRADIAQTMIREPAHFGALSGLGLVEMHLGNYKAALNAYEAAHQLHPFLEGYDEITQSLRKSLGGLAL